MTGEERRERILDAIRAGEKPVSGSALAAVCQVSRQIVVQDIALLRAAGYDIVSTTRGYLLQSPQAFTRTYCVKHENSQIEEELNAIVDMGGRVLDVYVEHSVYGRLRAELSIGSRRQVREFLDRIQNGKAQPLNNLTSGKHWHTVAADGEETLDLIGHTLRKMGYLVEK